VAKNLALNGLELISCQEKNTTLFEADIGEIFSLLFYHKISDLEKISFSHYLAVMLKAGVPIIEIIDVLGDDVANPRFKRIIKQLRNELEAGRPISSLLEKEKFFSKAHLAILKAGESSGKVEESLARISNDLNRDYQMKRKIKGAMAYPSIILVALVLIGGFIITFVLPKVGDVFRQMNLKIPLPTRILLATGNFINNNLLIIGVAVAVLIIFFTFLFRTTNLGLRLLVKVIMAIPMIRKITQQINMARFVRSLSSLLSSGVPIAQSLEISGEVFVEGYYQKIMKNAVRRVEKGDSLTNVFSDYKKSFEGILVKLCSVGERSGRLAELLGELSEFYEKEVDERLETVSTIVEPVLMLLVGAGVAVMVLAIIGPIYQMIGNLTP
jgi:type II secretory pathway component PulF